MFELGVGTYQIAKDWDIDTLIANCTEVGFTGAELRTSHAHGVEVGLDQAADGDVLVGDAVDDGHLQLCATGPHHGVGFRGDDINWKPDRAEMIECQSVGSVADDCLRAITEHQNAVVGEDAVEIKDQGVEVG